MSLSVNITLEVVNADIRPSNPDVKLHLRLDGKRGVAYTDWATLVSGAEVTGLVHAPSGQGLRTSHKRLRRTSMQQEQEVAESLGGRRQSGSGARPGNKGDGQVLAQGVIDNLEGGPGRFRIENRFVTAESYRLKLSDLKKIRAECTGRETPVFNIQFREKGTLRPLDDWVLVPRREWEALAQTDDHR